jgi:tRNA A-37 threonylcarbamoyl transferase component Bud32
MENPSLPKMKAIASTDDCAISEAGFLGKLTIGHYRLIECIGQGGMGTVYKAQHTSLKKTVALKVMTTAVANTGSSARFDQEMIALGKLSHPNVVAAFDAGVEEGLQYIVTEYVEGLDVRDLVSLVGPLDPANGCQIARDVAAGLAHIHGQGLVHRDVKPSNLMLTADGHVKVLDLGLALLPDSNQLTQSGQIMGTFDYMAPEQWGDTHAVDERADIYSLGCSLFYMLAGNPPFGQPTNTSTEKMRAHLLSPPPSIAAQRSDVPKQLDRLIHSMLEKEPVRRPQTMAEVIARLEDFAQRSDLNGLYRRAIDPDSEARVADAVVGSPQARPWRLLFFVFVFFGLGLGVAGWYAAGSIGLLGNSFISDLRDDSTPNATAIAPKFGIIRRHAARVNGVGISPDGRHIVSVGEDCVICIIDPLTHKVLALEESHPQAIAAVAFLAKDKVATACADGNWRVWTLTSNGQLIAQETSPTSAGAGLNFIRGDDPKQLLTGGWNNKVSIWDLQHVDEPPITFSSSDAVYDAVLSRDGSKLLWCGRNGAIRYENLQNGRRLNEWTAHSPEWVLSVDISADDRYAASAGWDDTVRVWALESGEEVAKLPCIKPKVVRFFSNGHRLAYGGREGKIVVWDLELKKQIHLIEDHGPVDCLAIAPDDNYLVSGTDVAFTVSVWPLP